MATRAVYDGPGIYDRPYQVKESLENLKDTIRVLGTKESKMRAIDEFIAELTARRARVVAGTETDIEKFGNRHTILASGPVTTLPITRPS